MRLHDLRHAFASVAASSGMGLPIIGKMLGHTQPATTARYAHLASDPVKAAAAAVAGKIAAAMAAGSGDAGKGGATVLPLRLTLSRTGGDRPASRRRGQPQRASPPDMLRAPARRDADYSDPDCCCSTKRPAISPIAAKCPLRRREPHSTEHFARYSLAVFSRRPS